MFPLLACAVLICLISLYALGLSCFPYAIFNNDPMISCSVPISDSFASICVYISDGSACIFDVIFSSICHFFCAMTDSMVGTSTFLMVDLVALSMFLIFLSSFLVTNVSAIPFFPALHVLPILCVYASVSCGIS